MGTILFLQKIQEVFIIEKLILFIRPPPPPSIPNPHLTNYDSIPRDITFILSSRVLERLPRSSNNGKPRVIRHVGQGDRVCGRKVTVLYLIKKGVSLPSPDTRQSSFVHGTNKEEDVFTASGKPVRLTSRKNNYPQSSRFPTVSSQSPRVTSTGFEISISP